MINFDSQRPSWARLLSNKERSEGNARSDQSCPASLSGAFNGKEAAFILKNTLLTVLKQNTCGKKTTKNKQLTGKTLLTAEGVLTTDGELLPVWC